MRGFLVLFFVFNFIAAQKVVKKTIVDSAISSFQIDAAYCFEMNIESVKSNVIVVEAIIDGEYKKDLVLNVNEEGATVSISAGFQPNFVNPNDKLSAHKVVSIALNIKLPEHKYVTVFGTSCNVAIEGTYKKIKVTLNDGTCSLVNVCENVDVATQSGTIYVKTKSGKVIRSSKYGRIVEDKISDGDTEYLLSTVTGDIFIEKIE